MSGIRATTPAEITFRQADTPATRAQKLELLRTKLSKSSISLSVSALPTAPPATPLFIYRLRGESWLFEPARCFAEALIAASAPTALRIFNGAAQVGTITFTGTAGAVAFTNASFASGALFEVLPPLTADATLDQLSISLGFGIV